MSRKVDRLWRCPEEESRAVRKAVRKRFSISAICPMLCFCSQRANIKLKLSLLQYANVRILPTSVPSANLSCCGLFMTWFSICQNYGWRWTCLSNLGRQKISCHCKLWFGQSWFYFILCENKLTWAASLSNEGSSVSNPVDVLFS